MLWMPRSSTDRASTATTRPVSQAGTSKLVKSAAEIELAWVILPIPKDDTTTKKANKPASPRPIYLFLKPFFIAYIGPPAISPTLLVSRYLTASTDSAYFVDKPNAALIHIQTSAPGPPRTIAVATPTILPVPTVAESAVISDWNGEMSPSCSFFCRNIIRTA